MYKNLNNVHKSVQKCYKIFKPRLLSVLSTKMNIGFLCALYAVLGLQGMVVKCKAAIFFLHRIIFFFDILYFIIFSGNIGKNILKCIQIL